MRDATDRHVRSAGPQTPLHAAARLAASLRSQLAADRLTVSVGRGGPCVDAVLNDLLAPVPSAARAALRSELCRALDELYASEGCDQLIDTHITDNESVDASSDATESAIAAAAVDVNVTVGCSGGPGTAPASEQRQLWSPATVTRIAQAAAADEQTASPLVVALGRVVREDCRSGTALHLAHITKAAGIHAARAVSQHLIGAAGFRATTAERMYQEGVACTAALANALQRGTAADVRKRLQWSGDSDALVRFGAAHSTYVALDAALAACDANRGAVPPMTEAQRRTRADRQAARAARDGVGKTADQVAAATAPPPPGDAAGKAAGARGKEVPKEKGAAAGTAKDTRAATTHANANSVRGRPPELAPPVADADAGSVTPVAGQLSPKASHAAIGSSGGGPLFAALGDADSTSAHLLRLRLGAGGAAASPSRPHSMVHAMAAALLAQHELSTGPATGVDFSV
jgi:hypothetical protein